MSSYGARHAGRNFLRCVEGRTNSNLNIVVINDSGALFPLFCLARLVIVDLMVAEKLH